jgi:hypothetical protein
MVAQQFLRNPFAPHPRRKETEAALTDFRFLFSSFGEQIKESVPVISA